MIPPPHRKDEAGGGQREHRQEGQSGEKEEKLTQPTGMVSISGAGEEVAKCRECFRLRLVPLPEMENQGNGQGQSRQEKKGCEKDHHSATGPGP